MVWIHLTKLKKKKQNFHLQWNFEILTCPRPLPQSRTYLVPLGRSSTSMPWICGSNLTSRSSQPTRLSRCWLPFSGSGQAAFVHPLVKFQENTCRIHYLQFSVVCCIFILLSFDLLMALSAMSCKGAVALFVVFETFDDRFNQQRNK
ncbi:hypothetical protein QL285_006926 [Trifolium repens]|nr:hypothetical protein QL285_006926 [Trifolium repens]